jgi:hypothetical protein
VFLATNRDLLVHGVQERTIGNHFADALRPLYPTYEVDTEYNKHGYLTKIAMIMYQIRRFSPDILVHQRRTDQRNHLAIEIKQFREASAVQKAIRIDRFRLLALRREPFCYRYTFQMLYTIGNEADLWFEAVPRNLISRK